jgi:UDP-N-acetylmuramyl-tripeptide synthetase
MNMRKLVKKIIPSNLFKVIEPYGHWGEAVLAQARLGFPANKLKIIGVTGTDGKTTTCMLIAQMLRSSGVKVGMLTTAASDFGDGKGVRPNTNAYHMTTASVDQLLRDCQTMQANGVEWLVLETSAHALAQYRVWGIPYSVGVFTNLTHEHLDYFGTMERYRAIKQRLFRLVARNKRGLGVGVTNVDDPSGESFASLVSHPIRYGLENGDLRASDIKLTSGGSRFVARYAGGIKEAAEYRIECHLPGRFNVYNCLAAIGVGLALGLTKQQIEQGIASMRAVPGRMMRLETNKPFDVYIDYAVTPVAMQTVLQAVRETTKGSVMVVFGATGDRDTTKRGPMGEVAAKYADQIFLTDDETYTEDPASIRQAVYAGIKAAGGAGKCQEFGDRREAIRAAIAAAKPGDSIVITGMGHQTTRNMGGKDEPWSDTDAAQELLVFPQK